MSKRRKRNSKNPVKREAYAGPFLRSGRFIEMEDAVYEFTIPKTALSDEEWTELVEEGWEVGHTSDTECGEAA